MGIRLSSGSKGHAFDNAVAESFGSLMPDLGMFEDTGALLRMPGGNVENIADQKPVISWAGLNVGGEVERDPSRWNRQLSLYADARITTLPWLHCHTLGDVDFLISVGKQWDSPAIGLNIEDVHGDKLDLSQVARHLESWTGEILMPTLPWVQNGQGWSQLARCVAALEIFPDENDDSKKPQDCIEHAFAEGLTKVTLMVKTKPPNLPEQYDLSLCHSLYTADDITPTRQAWAAWNHRGKEHPPMPPKSKSSPKASGGSNWHEKRYPKNPDPPEIAFVRPLYPPDAVEKDRKPSSPGPDVKAIKRAISHAQRFLPWVPEEWDDIYDDVIAHGDGSGIDRSGVAGFQQQMGIEPTGWVGKATFEALRTCLIPSKPGVPHAGEPLFDAVCVRLFKQAAELPAPEEPTTLEPEHPIEPSHGDYDSYEGAFRKAKFTRLGGPAAHRAKALAGWESDNAFDYGLPVGTPLYALDDGVIGGNLGPMESNPSDGSRVQLNADSNAYWYGHLSRVVVRSGQRVKRGQLLGYSGASSNGAAHLHLGVQHLDRG